MPGGKVMIIGPPATSLASSSFSHLSDGSLHTIYQVIKAK